MRKLLEARLGPDSERGSMLVVLPILFVGLFMLLGVVIDGGGRVSAMQSVHLVAADAARAGAQEVDASDQLLEGVTRVNSTQAMSRAQAALANAGMSGDVNVNASRTVITVTARDDFQTTLLSVFGINGGQVEATESAQLARIN